MRTLDLQYREEVRSIFNIALLQSSLILLVLSVVAACPCRCYSCTQYELVNLGGESSPKKKRLDLLSAPEAALRVYLAS